MIKHKNTLIIALMIPIFTLALISANKQYNLMRGEEFIFPIVGYDPRDLLSGHYLTYQIDYGISGICNPFLEVNRKAYICLSSKVFSYYPVPNCKTQIQGVCNYSNFEAGIERFYVPENRAQDLDMKIRSHSAAISLSITSEGKAQVKDLLINGKSWR